MRVLIIVESFGGGVGRHCVDLVLGLTERSHEVHLIYSSARMDAGTTLGLAAMQRAGVQTFELPMKRAPGPPDAAMVQEIRSYIKSQGPFDVIHGQSSKGGALARLARPPYPSIVVYTPHAISTMNPTMSRLQRRIWAGVEKAFAKKTDGILCVSPDEELHIVEMGIAPEKLFMVLNGIAEPTEQPVRPSPKVIGFVGRLEPQKDPENLIRAFAKANRPGWSLSIVGYGPLEEECKALAKSLKIDDRILWLGNANGAEAMRSFGIFCMSSRYEAMPYVLLEALAAGIPIVSTDCGGAKTTIEDNGLIVPIENSDALADALAKVMEDDDLRTQMGDASFQRAKEFSLDRMVDTIVKIYEELIDQKRARGR